MSISMEKTTRTKEEKSDIATCGMVGNLKKGNEERMSNFVKKLPTEESTNETEIVNIGHDVDWVEKLWNQKSAEDTKKPKSAEAETNAYEEYEDGEEHEEHFEALDGFVEKSVIFEKKIPQDKNKSNTAELGQHDREEKIAATQVPKCESFPDSLLEFTRKSSCIPPAYFGPAFDESCFQCCIRICPVVYSDLVRKDFSPVLARADCVRMSLGSKSTPRLLEIYCQRSAPLLYNLMFCPYSNNTVIIELERKKPTGWKTVTLKDRVFKVPSLYSLEDCTKAKFQLKSAFFRHNLGKIISVNTRQHMKERSLFISNIPATVDRSLVKQIFPLAGKISWVNTSENLRSAVLTMKSRRMVLDHIAAMRQITINEHELKIGAVGMKQEDAERLLEDDMKTHQDQGWNFKTEKEKVTKREGSNSSTENVNIKPDKASNDDKLVPGLCSEHSVKTENRKEEDEEASFAQEQNGQLKMKEMEVRDASREDEETEKTNQEEQDMWEKLEREWQRTKQVDRKLPGSDIRKQAHAELLSSGIPDEAKRLHGQGLKLENPSSKGRLKSCPLYQERQEELAVEQEVILQRVIEPERGIHVGKNMHMERKKEIQREWQSKEQLEQEDLRNIDQVHQEEDKWHQKEILQLKRIRQEAIQKLHIIAEQQKQGRKKQEDKLDSERVQAQYHLDKESLHKQHEKEEVEYVATTRKRYRSEEPLEKEDGMLTSKRGRKDDYVWSKLFNPVGSGRLDSASGHSNVQLEASVKRKLELEVARQAEELKKSLALLDKIQKDPSGISASMNEIRGSAHKGHGCQDLWQTISFQRTQKVGYQGYSQYPHLRHHQSSFGSSYDYSSQLQGCFEKASHDYRPAGSKLGSEPSDDDCRNQRYASKDSDITPNSGLARESHFWMEGGEHRGGKQDQGPQRKESAHQRWQRTRDSSQDGRKMDKAGTSKQRGESIDEQRARSFVPKKDTWSGSSCHTQRGDRKDSY